MNIKERMAPVRDLMINERQEAVAKSASDEAAVGSAPSLIPTWEELCAKCIGGYAEGLKINLSCTASYAPPGKHGLPGAADELNLQSEYFSFGAGVAETEVDILTGVGASFTNHPRTVPPPQVPLLVANLFRCA